MNSIISSILRVKEALCVSVYYRFSISEGFVFPDYLEVTTAVEMVKLLPVHRYIFHIPDLQE